MEEQSFLSEGEITVTTTRFIVPSQTYAMSGITSVKSSYDPANRLYPIVCGVIGLLCMVPAPFAAFFFIVIAIIWWIGQKTTYHVVLTTASGEAKALTSTNKQFIAKVIEALNNAIVARG